MKKYKAPKMLSFPSDIKGVRVNEGKEQIKVLCSDNKYHWVDFSRYIKNKMKIQFSLTEFVRGVRLPFNIDTPEFQQCIIGKEIYLEHYTEVGKITGIDVAEDLIFAEVPNKKYQSHAIDAKGYNKCLFEVVKL